MQWQLTHNDRILTPTEPKEMEIEQLNLSFKKQVDNAKWDPVTN